MGQQNITRRYMLLLVLMYLVYGSTEYSKEIHVVIGTNVLSVWLYRI